MKAAPAESERGELIALLFQDARLRIRQAGAFEPTPAWGMDARRIDDWQLYAFLSGRGRFEQGAHRLAVGEGDVILCAPKEPYSLHQLGRQYMGHVSVHFTLTFPGELDLMAWLRPPARLTHPGFASILPLLVAAARDKSRLGRERLRGLLTWMLADVAARLSTREVGSERPGKLHLILKFHQALKTRLSHPGPLRPICAELGISMGALEKETRRLTGKRPLQLILEAKIARAGELLEGGESVTACARQLGFSDIYYFSRMFKKTAGMSPKRWLESARRG